MFTSRLSWVILFSLYSQIYYGLMLFNVIPIQEGEFLTLIALFPLQGGGNQELRQDPMVDKMVQKSQSLYSFTFNAFIVIHTYIYSHSTTEFTFKNYIYSHLPVYFLFTIIFAHIYEISLFTFNMLYLFTIKIFIQHFLRTTFAHHQVLAIALQFLNAWRTEGDQRPVIMTPNTRVTWAKLELWS